MKKLLAVILVAAFSAFAWFSLPSLDQSRPPGTGQQTASGSGLVLAIDKENGIVKISHGAVPALGMPPMTMGFPVKDKRQLSKLQPMQKVEFELAYNGSDYLIIDIR